METSDLEWDNIFGWLYVGECEECHGNVVHIAQTISHRLYRCNYCGTIIKYKSNYKRGGKPEIKIFVPKFWRENYDEIKYSDM